MPLARGDRLILSTSIGGQHHVARQVVAAVAQPVQHPRPHARPTGDLCAGVHERMRRVVVDLLRGHRPDDTDVIGNAADMRQCLGDRLAGFAILLKLMLRPKALQRLVALQLRNRLTVGDRLGHPLAVHLGQLRFVVERLEMRRPACHAEMDHPLGLGREMQRVNRPGGCQWGGLLGQATRPQHRGQRQRADTHGDPVQERAAVQLVGEVLLCIHFKNQKREVVSYRFMMARATADQAATASGFSTSAAGHCPAVAACLAASASALY